MRRLTGGVYHPEVMRVWPLIALLGLGACTEEARNVAVPTPMVDLPRAWVVHADDQGRPIEILGPISLIDGALEPDMPLELDADLGTTSVHIIGVDAAILDRALSAQSAAVDGLASAQLTASVPPSRPDVFIMGSEGVAKLAVPAEAPLYTFQDRVLPEFTLDSSTELRAWLTLDLDVVEVCTSTATFTEVEVDRTILPSNASLRDVSRFNEDYLITVGFVSPQIGAELARMQMLKRGDTTGRMSSYHPAQGPERFRSVELHRDGAPAEWGIITGGLFCMSRPCDGMVWDFTINDIGDGRFGLGAVTTATRTFRTAVNQGAIDREGRTIIVGDGGLLLIRDRRGEPFRRRALPSELPSVTDLEVVTVSDDPEFPLVYGGVGYIVRANLDTGAEEVIELSTPDLQRVHLNDIAADRDGIWAVSGVNRTYQLRPGQPAEIVTPAYHETTLACLDGALTHLVDPEDIALDAGHAYVMSECTAVTRITRGRRCPSSIQIEGREIASADDFLSGMDLWQGWLTLVGPNALLLEAKID